MYSVQIVQRLALVKMESKQKEKREGKDEESKNGKKREEQGSR